MTYALPDYLGKHSHFDDCPPGHRFGLYFDGWQGDFSAPRDGKTALFRPIVNSLPTHSRSALKAIRVRQQALASDLGDIILIHPARLSAPLATGLGNEHPLENGFAFLNPHGLPYLAGSGVKGVIRRAAEELETGEWGGKAGWNADAIRILFGPGEEDPERDTHARRGALMFWDLFFQPASDKDPLLAMEIMTPHHRDYLQGTGSPHANEQPNPIPFLAVRPGCECTLYVQCNPALIPPEAAALRTDWHALVGAAIEHAGQWLGFGAKTAAGYGRLGQDAALRKKLADEAAERAAQAEREAALANLSAEGKAIAEFVEACESRSQSGRKDPCNPGSGLYAEANRLSKAALADDSGWSAEDRARLADVLTEWLPKVVDKLDRKDEWKSAAKRLGLNRLRGF
ncbi:MAG TPA: type III-B CRISPR module RAMP protein Cmr6 [Rhodocyclaceae bacterium]|nr:type III-B CRISPR module RAMP protein Cmr6 [Rhodocyclaceae bacterium]